MRRPAVTFDPRALYRPPTGRMAIYVPPAQGHRDGLAYFEYVRLDTATGRRRLADGFALARANWGIVQQVTA